MIYITAIHLEGGEGHERISSVRWKQPSSGKSGEASRATMVKWIRDEKMDVRVTDGRTEAKVGVVDGNPPYLRTHADGKWTNNLLALPRY